MLSTPNVTAMRLGGLLFALGLFSIGPASNTVHEFLFLRGQKKGIEGRNNDNKNEQQQEDTPTAANQLKRRYTYTNQNHPQINDHLSHPFQQISKPSATNASPSSNVSWLSFLGLPKE